MDTVISKNVFKAFSLYLQQLLPRHISHVCMQVLIKQENSNGV